MLKFYKKAVVLFFSLLVFTLLAAYVCVQRTFPKKRLLPAQESSMPWRTETWSDHDQGGTSTMAINDATYSLDFDFKVTKDFEYPYVSLVVVFKDENNIDNFIDLSRYKKLSFSIKCKPKNVLSYVVFTLDEKISQAENLPTYRIPSTFFSCEEDWTKVEIDLTRLEIPEWWLRNFGFELSNKEYKLDKVLRFSFGSSAQSPYDTLSNVKVDALTLYGRDWRYLYLLCFLGLLFWGGFVYWFFRQHSKTLIIEITEKIKKDRPLVSYQQLSIEPKKDKDKALILHFLATEYANPDLSLEMASSTLGINKNKINDVLKHELGFTFSAYLNKLRLTEAARLLSEEKEANVAEIACSVGYNNTSYFNKLFKGEYGCTPKTFKNIYRSNSN